MNLSPAKFNILNSSMRSQNKLNASYKHPFSNEVSFKGADITTFQKIVTKNSTTYTDANKIIKTVDGIIGNDFLASTLKKAGVQVKDGNIVFNSSTFLGDIISTIKYPFGEMWLDIAIASIKGIRKIPSMELWCDGLLNSKVLLNRAKTVEQQKSLSCVMALLEEFSSHQKGVIDKNDPTKTIYNFKKASDNFKYSAASGIIDPARNYILRDERTLNRLGTATVSAFYSGADFYNIAMLQKNDDKEAKKAENNRRKQELARMFLSGATTFLTLGVFNKYAKNSVIKNSIIIAFSSLVAEVGSRLLSNTSLLPLSPEKAAEVSRQNKEDVKGKNIFKHKTEKTASQNQDNKENKTLPQQITADKPSQPEPEFKSNKAYKINLYKQFTGENSLLEKTREDLSKKGINPLKIASTCFVIFSALYFAKKGIKGEYTEKIFNKQVFQNNEQQILDFAAGKLDFESQQKLINQVMDELSKKNNAISANKKGARKFIDFLLDKYKKLANFGEKHITHNAVEVKLSDIDEKINGLIKTDKSCETLLETYRELAHKFANKENNTISIYKRRHIISGFYKGFKKMYNLIEFVFSLPAKGINELINTLFFDKSSKAIKSIVSEAKGIEEKKLRKSVSEFVQTIFNREEIKELYGPYDLLNRKRRSPEEIIKSIKDSTRNFDQSIETGDVAHFSRTLVTLVSSYFFVNDYRNRVLIDSEGKDVDGAKRERNERIAHKASNFIINGTLMNIFNSVFKRPLNESLLGATLVAMATEMTNESLVRKSICQPIGRMESKESLMEYEKQQLERRGIFGAWSKLFRRITGKKTLVQKAGVDEDKK